MAFTTIIVTETFEPAEPGGPAVTGEAVFTLSARITDGAGNEVEPEAIPVQIATGQMSVTLYANDDPTTVPTETYYTVQLQLNGYPPQRSLQAVVPHTAAGGTCTLSSIATPNPS